MSAELHQPIIILGAARSGTTALARVLSHHPDVAVWEEPKHIWRFGHAYRSHDVLTARDATPRIKRYIRDQFTEFLRASGRTRFAEKTPSNCFRVSFIREVFPDALFVHVVRDGRAVTVSAMEQWKHDYVGSFDEEYTPNTSFQGDRSKNRSSLSALANGWRTTLKFLREKNRLAGGPAVWLEAPAYIPDLARVYLRKLTGPDRSFVWGPKYPGIQEVHRTQGLLAAAALQWVLSVQYVLANAHTIPTDHFMHLAYEDLTADAEGILASLSAFAHLEPSDQFLQSGTRLLQAGTDNWRAALSTQEQETLASWLRLTLTSLGFVQNAVLLPPSADG